MTRANPPNVNKLEYQIRRKLRVFRLWLSAAKDIPHASDGLNSFLTLVSVHFTAESAHQDVHHICLWIEMVVPDVFQNHGF